MIEPNPQASPAAKDALSIFLRSLSACTVESAVPRIIHSTPTDLYIRDRAYDLSSVSEFVILSIGKAGATLFDAVTAQLPASIPLRAVVSAPAPPRLNSANLAYFAGGHPLPNAASVQAAQAAFYLLGSAAPDALVLYLISGGASAMFELPPSPSITLDDLITFNRQLVASGAPIREINTLRKHLSQVKGGGLALAASGLKQISLFLSDVPANQLDLLASGPTLPDSSTLNDCRAILKRFDLERDLPASIRDWIAAGAEETPKPHHPTFRHLETHVLLSNEDILNAASTSAKALGYEVYIDNACDDWPCAYAARYLVDRAHELRAATPRGCLLSGGEVAVKLPLQHGSGGRNQHFALFATTLPEFLAGDFTLLSAGTDGIDGYSPAAGAIVDATTVTTAAQAGLDIPAALRHFNAFPILESLNATITTGPTGNNLRDLRLILWDTTQ